MSRTKTDADVTILSIADVSSGPFKTPLTYPYIAE
ncbi:hypothetical protein HDF25_005181 [Pedobacter cryoconitis]|uniref:Uncharacterized protein n=1 Tax=Pedobacter cryoconitis TaxID=188932 RepID=A0A7X0J925_9SPHI|nr:hypothetical protein [Pedobacter cryoconitis]